MAEGYYGRQIYKKEKSFLSIVLIICGGVLLIAGIVFILQDRESESPNQVIESQYREERPVKGAGKPATAVEKKLNESGPESQNQPGGAAEKTTIEPSVTVAEADKTGPLKEAFRQYELGNFRQALEKFLGYPDNPEAATYAGICHYRLGDYKKAVETLENVLARDGSIIPAKKFLGFSYYQLNQYKKAREMLEAVLAAENDPESRALLAKITRENEAMEDYGETKRVKFNVFFSKMEHQDIGQKIVDMLQDAYRSIGDEFDSFPEDPITVILYNEITFNRVTSAPGWAAGLYDGKIRIPIQGIEGRENDLQQTVKHEFVHALIHTITPSCPIWVNEGLAEYYSEDNRPKVGQVIPLNKLDNGFPMGNVQAVALAYQESHAAVAYLIDRYGMFRMKDLLTETGKSNDFPASFQKTYYMTYDKFLSEWGKN